MTLNADGSTGMRLSDADQPVEVLRAAASVLEGFAAFYERENEPISCGTCGVAPMGVEAAPSGEWRFAPCGHGVPAAH